MSLVGRLEDLSPSDIIQIVFLSRRSGRLELNASAGRFAIHFSNGLIAGATSPDSPDLGSYLEREGYTSATQLAETRRIVDEGIPLGDVLVDCNLLAPADLTCAIESRIGMVMEQIDGLAEGEFDFVLANAPSALGAEYDLPSLIGAEGYPPQKFLRGGEKLKPLQGLEESVRAGKAFLRGAPSTNAATLSEPVTNAPAAPDISQKDEGGLPRGFDPDATRPGPTASQFRVRDEGIQTREPGDLRITVVIYEPDPVLRVAIKRALSGLGVETIQTHSADECRAEMTRLIESHRYFLSIVDVTPYGASESGHSLISLLKRTNPGLPVASLADTSVPASAMQLQADEVIALPAASVPERYDVSPAIESLTAFVLNEAERWRMVIAANESEEQACRSFYEQTQAERTSRRYELLELLIVELSDPEDSLSLGRTLLRAGSEYVDRGAVFLVGEDEFLGLAGFGAGGVEEVVNESIKGARIPFSERSVLRDVMEGRRTHRGKLRKTPANVELVQRLGRERPSEVLVVPIARGTKVVGVFYGDNGGNGAPISETSGLEIFLGQSGRALEKGLRAGEARARGGEESR